MCVRCCFKNKQAKKTQPLCVCQASWFSPLSFPERCNRRCSLVAVVAWILPFLCCKGRWTGAACIHARGGQACPQLWSALWFQSALCGQAPLKASWWYKAAGWGRKDVVSDPQTFWGGTHPQSHLPFVPQAAQGQRRGLPEIHGALLFQRLQNPSVLNK